MKLFQSIKSNFARQKQEGSVLILTISLMLLFSGQILMVGLVTTKSLAESGALNALGMAAREEAFGAMADFESKELYPAYMAKVDDARRNVDRNDNPVGPVTPVTGEELWDDYSRDAVVRTDEINNLARQDWSDYRQRLWDPNTNAYVNGQFTTNVWFEARLLPGPDNIPNSGDDLYEWPFTIVARVRGSGVDQILRRQTTIIPDGFRDF
ncbi:MAG: hypothetical protein LW809_04865 [Vampirovibrionales bacterium]|nr:hypothetical protein [Vampirovibrionales bacterium]